MRWHEAGSAPSRRAAGGGHWAGPEAALRRRGRVPPEGPPRELQPERAAVCGPAGPGPVAPDRSWWGRRDSNPRTPRRQDPLPWILSPASPKAAGFLWPGLITPPRWPAGGGDLTVGGRPQIRRARSLCGRGGRCPVRGTPSRPAGAQSSTHHRVRFPSPYPPHGRPQSSSKPQMAGTRRRSHATPRGRPQSSSEPLHAGVILAPCDARSQVPRPAQPTGLSTQAGPCAWDGRAASPYALGPYAPAYSGCGRWTVDGSTICPTAGL